MGFYNPANGQLVYIGDTDLDQTERYILAHELTHAIDDQHFGLRRLDAIGARCDDEAFTAGLGAIEGSAQYFATQVLDPLPVRRAARRRRRRRRRRIERRAAVRHGPAALAVRRRDGVHPARWTRRAAPPQVDEALTTFPVSTEQILHPERWPNDVPQPVDVPDLGPALGTDGATWT